jgi:hypothetical protein
MGALQLVGEVVQAAELGVQPEDALLVLIAAQ